MPNLVSDITSGNRIEVAKLLEHWEQKTGKPRHDIRMCSEVHQRALKAIRELKLDPADTISSELYFALQDKARIDNQQLAIIIGVDESDNPTIMLEKIIKWIFSNNINLESWALKPVFVKTIIKKDPPKAVMKLLGIRSIDSMLKRSNMGEIINLIFEVESLGYQQKILSAIKKASINDFSLKQISFDQVDTARIQKLSKTKFNLSKVIIPCFMLADITFITPKSRFPLDVLAIVMLIEEVIDEQKKTSSFIKAISMRPDFGEIFSVIIQEGVAKVSHRIAEVGWNSIHKHLVGNEDFFAILEHPYLTKDDFDSNNFCSLLKLFGRNFDFWEGLGYVLYKDKNSRLVSLNLLDVTENMANKNNLNEQSIVYAKNKFWEELWSRYLSHEHIADDILTKFVYG